MSKVKTNKEHLGNDVVHDGASSKSAEHDKAELKKIHIVYMEI